MVPQMHTEVWDHAKCRVTAHTAQPELSRLEHSGDRSVPEQCARLL